MGDNELGAPSPAEMEVLELIACGLMDKEIAVRLIKSNHTVRTQVRAVCSKLGARNRTHAVVIAIARGLLPRPSA